ncbi:MAG TPA: phosphoglycerate dehydrogenase [Candidatus Acidoferrum sp.]|nr:phosphoglycerate dehydrogenase [Candidatus Acidoferrum sp.]
MPAPSTLGRVVVAEPFDERGVAVLREAGAEVVSLVGSPREALHEALRDARGLIVRSETRVDAQLLAAAPHLEVVARAGVGVDAIDVDAATAAGIVVVNTPAANTLAATEHTFALLLAAMRNIPQANASVHAAAWERKPFIGHELYGKVLGIVGLGRIGSNIASRAAAFGMQVIAHDPYVAASRAGALGVELVSFEELLTRAQIVTLHVPLTPQTRGMIDARALARMQDDAVLVNCARGAVLDADALLATLEAGRLRRVAIDVVPQEPPPPGSASARILSHERVIATPHLGGSTYEALERIALELAGDVVRVLGGRPASGAVNAPMLAGADAERAGAFIDLAHRFGALVPQLFDEALREELALVLRGELEGVDAEPFVAALLAGALPLVTDRRVTLVNAGAIARELGVRTAISRESDASPFRAALVVAAGDHRIVGTVLPHGPRIVEIDGFEIDAVAEGTMLVTRHRDVPGMVGRIGTILGQANVNISTMQVARTVRGGEAMMVLDVDREIERSVVDAIARVDGMDDVRLVRV